jgi:hypothetical protein
MWLALAIVAPTAGRAAAQDTTGVGSFSGSVVDAARAPAAFATICLAGTTQCVPVDERGAFRLANLRPGEYVLEVTPVGESTLPVGRFEVRAGVDQRLEITLPARERLQTSVTVTAPSVTAPPEVKTSVQLISGEEIFRAAGALQDVSRYVQALPGVVVGSDDFRNDIIVRGGSPLENLFIVDNVEIPNINTFANFASAGGTVSILDPAMIRDVTFLTGGYPASYTNRTSSVLQITQREGSRDALHARATLGFAGAGGVVEGPLSTGKGSWIVSARRSFLDLFTNDIGVGGVPVLYTLNAKAVYDLNPTNRVWVVNVAGIDRIRLGPTDSMLNDEERRGGGGHGGDEILDVDIRYRGWRSGTGLNWQHLFGSRAVGLFGVTNSRASVGQTVKDVLKNGVPPVGTPADQLIALSPVVFRSDASESETTVKYDATVTASPKGTLQFGGSVKLFRLDYQTAAPIGFDSPYSLQPGRNSFSIDDRFTAWQSAAYVQVTRNVTSALNVTVGGRFDHYQYIDASRLSPRLAATLALTRRLSLKGSTGFYHQQPAFQFLAVFPEHRSLKPFRAIHYVGGLVYGLANGLSLSVEGYRKSYRDYPVATDFPSLSLANLGDTFNVLESLMPLMSEGRGYSQGLEFNLTKKDDGHWYGQANVSVSKTRHAGLDGVLRPGSFDYPFVFNMTGGRRWSSKWESSLRVSLLSGRPYTPFDLVESTRQRRGIYDLSQVNDRRASTYFRLDARLDRNATFFGRAAIVFVGVQNLTGRRNVSGYAWDRWKNAADATERLGVFPLVGLEWRF